MIITSTRKILQIFLIYLKNQSTDVADAVYLINWIGLTNRTKKDLVLMMIRATKPIQLTGTSAIIMSIKTFVKVCIFVCLCLQKTKIAVNK